MKFVIDVPQVEEGLVGAETLRRILLSKIQDFWGHDATAQIGLRLPGWHEEHDARCDGSHQHCDSERCDECGKLLLNVTSGHFNDTVEGAICPHNWKLVQQHLYGMKVQ